MSQSTPAAPLKIAIVGCGAITQIHYVPALRELARAGVVELSALVDPSADSLAAVAAHFPRAVRFDGLGEAVLPAEAAIVASPASAHAEQARQLLGRGLHVLCEKPMAATLAQCESMVAAARSAQRLLAVGLFRRFFSGASQMRELVASRALGAVRSFEIVEGNRFQWRAKTDSFFRKSSGGGGVLLDIGVHVLDLMLWWFGEPEHVVCEDDAMGGIEANCRLRCSFPGGVSGSVRLSRDWNLRNRYLVRFERGWAGWTPADPQGLELGVSERHALAARVHDAASSVGRPALGAVGANYYESFIAQIENFAAAVRGRATLVVPGEEGLRSIRLIETCYRESRLMEMPWLTDAEARAAEAMR
jgi:predicted dehydrogenase